MQNLLPDQVICYYAKFLAKWSKVLTNTVEIDEDMELVKVDKNIDKRFKPCICNARKPKDEL